MLCIVLLVLCCFLFFFFKQKTAYEMRISDWSSDVCSSDLPGAGGRVALHRLDEQGGDEDRPEHAEAEDEADHRGGGELRIPEQVQVEERRARVELPDDEDEDGERAADELEHDDEIGRASWRERVCPYV